MKFLIDHDYHIHSHISSCATNPAQDTARILQYALERGLSRICLTDHYWDETVSEPSRWYKPQNFEHIAAARPLPQAEGVSFLFGCETDMKLDGSLGIPPSRYDEFDFIIVPTTHLHMKNFTIPEERLYDSQYRADLWVSRLDTLLDSSLPFGKVGLAHPTSGLVNNTAPLAHHETLSRIPDSEIERLFFKASARGCGIELNYADMREIDYAPILRFYRIVKSCGCQFYLGSDAHEPSELAHSFSVWEHAIDLLGLTEDDKFQIKA